VSTSGSVVVGVDLGTSAIKVVAVGEDGAVRAVARRQYPTARPEPGAAEQDPGDWFAALAAALDELARAVPTATWVGMGLSAMLPTLVECDGENRPLAPAITWEDARAEPEAAVFCAAVGEDAVYRITGQRVDGRYLAPMHARMVRLGHGGVTVAGAKDVLFAHLTGELLTDPSTAAGSGIYDLDADRWDTELVAAAGIPRLPELAPAATTGRLHTSWARRLGLAADFPVVLGAADSVLGALGVRASSHGDVAVIAGTSAIVLGISDAPTRDPERRYLVTPMTGVNWGLEMDVLAVGSAFDGIARLLGLASPAALMQEAATVPLDEAPLFLPYLSPGEQGALWDPNLTGALHGLHLGMHSAHVSRALVTGVVIELRRCIDVLEQTTGMWGPVLLGGRSAVSPTMRQEIADATGREVRVDMSVDDHSAVGAALFTATSIGMPISRSVDVVTFAPRREMYDWWAESFARHERARLQRVG
jgi:xylulokinase